MTMHLVHPSLSTTGKRKGKQKFRNAAAAKASREHKDSWQELQKKWSVEKDSRRASKFTAWKPSAPVYRGSDQPKIASLPCTGEICARAPDKVYTGDKMLGISQMAKSNAVPVFNHDHIIEIARMRR